MINGHQIKTVSIIGSGNVAWWFVYALKKANIRIQQIYSRRAEHCQKLAEQCEAEAISELDKLQCDSDLYIFSLKDDVYETVVKQIPFRLPLAALTAGSVSQQTLADYATHYGIIYPCQSISQNSDFLTLNVPLCIEGSDKDTENALFNFAKLLCSNVFRVNETQRASLHRAAVFANNFTNAMYNISFDILQKADLEKDILFPLIQNTIEKVKTMTPEAAQTGPAKRGDRIVMQRQLESIDEELVREIYKSCSQYIMEKSRQNK